jgi:hypothetical protein
VKKRHKDFGERLVQSILQCFEYAYKLHAKGESEEGLLIQHDIVAAVSDVAPAIKKAHRRAVQSAVKAVDAGVPLPEARAYMMKLLTQKLDELLKKD